MKDSVSVMENEEGPGKDTISKKRSGERKDSEPGYRSGDEGGRRGQW